MSMGWYIFWHSVAVMVLVKGLRLVFWLWLVFGLTPKWGCFGFSLLWNVELYEVWVSFPSLYHSFACTSVGFSPWMGTKTASLFSLSSAVFLARRRGCPRMWLRPNDWTVLLDISHYLYTAWRRAGEKGPARSSLATLCITRMQMSYEAIHLLEMPPWFQFESCLQSHCVSPLLHVKEVSLCERSEGDNCT